jgi:transcriptional regulator
VYVQKSFNKERIGTLHRLVHQYPLATFIVVADGQPIVNHMPMFLDASISPHGQLRAHTPRDNTVWKLLDGSKPTLAIFHGPQRYITPSWYPSKQERGGPGKSDSAISGFQA